MPFGRRTALCRIEDNAMTNEIYETPTANLKLPSEEKATSASLLLKTFTFVFTIPNMAAGYFQQYTASSGNHAQAIGGVFGTLMFAGIIVLLFQMGSRFRNQRSRYKIFMWCQIVLFSLMALSAVTAFLQYVGKA